MKCDRVPVVRSARRVVLVLLVGLAVLGLQACFGGGSGDGKDDDDIDPGGGVGIGDDGVTVFWQQYESRKYQGLGRANDFAMTADGGFVLTGFASRAWGEPGHVFLVKADSSGNLLWRQVLEDATTSSAGNVVVQAANGGYVVGGYRQSGEHHLFYLLRTDANGNALAGWPKVYGPGGRGIADQGIADLYETDSGFVWVGQSADGKYLIAKVNHSGELVWGPRTYPVLDNPGWESATSIDANGDGFVVAGVDNGPNTLVGVLKTDSEGNLRAGWPRTYGEGAAFSVRSTPDGGFVIAGKAGRFPWPEGGDALLIKVDALGNESWRKTFGGNGNDEFAAVDVLSDGSIIAVGHTNSYSSGLPDVLMVKVSGSGETLWQKVIGRGPSDFDIAMSVRSHPDGSFVLAGEAGARPMLAKMDRNGNTVGLGDLENKITIPSVTGTINFNNGALVAGRGAEAPLLLRQFAAFGLDTLLIERPVSNDLCTGGGTYMPVLDPVTEGADYSITFTECVVNGADSLTLNGSLSVRVEDLSGALEEGGEYQVQLTYYDIELVTEDDGGEIRFAGRLPYNRVASGNSFTENVELSDIMPFIIVEGTTFQALRSGSLRYQLSGSAFTLTSVDGVVFELSGLEGNLDLAIVEPLSGSVFPEPEDGRIRITADDGSSAVVIITDDAVAIEVDTDGDGEVDGVLRTTWDDLI